MPGETELRHAIMTGAFTYTARPDPIPGDLRMSWGIAVLILILFYSRAKKSNFHKLQFLANSVRLPEGREEVRGLLSGVYGPADVSVRVEPSLNRAVAFACALKLVRVDRGTSISLTDKGIKVANEILDEQESFVNEKKFLKEVVPYMTDKLMQRVWRLEGAL